MRVPFFLSLRPSKSTKFFEIQQSSIGVLCFRPSWKGQWQARKRNMLRTKIQKSHFFLKPSIENFRDLPTLTYFQPSEGSAASTSRPCLNSYNEFFLFKKCHCLNWIGRCVYIKNKCGTTLSKTRSNTLI